MTAREPIQPVVYRVYDDDGRLIYIGSTTRFVGRMAAHRVTSWWTRLAVRFDVEVHLDVESARRAEMAAIHREAPAFNHAYNQRRFDEPLPLTERDVQVAREFAAGGRPLPYPMRGLRTPAS